LDMSDNSRGRTPPSRWLQIAICVPSKLTYVNADSKRSILAALDPKFI
jgi:hypothetical protein